MTRNPRGPQSGPEHEADGGATVEVVGEKRLALTRTDLDARPTVERECTVVCATGDRTAASWTGVPVPDLLVSAGAPPVTTHLRLTSDSGYRVHVEIATALDALVALARDGEDLVDAGPGTRFVGPGVDGEQSVKELARIEAVSLDPGEDPSVG
ncbi:molybdopterin-dependent oxidoreductase [Halostella sp. JP-L12]|uniref:molybdopterin-dependent oxidoreductase n=1 Tax=Halostella TaxID=1843185 RepID=UPI000EF81014|nr:MULTISPECIES: molybdopterin-dependent oxidoreductase [Halostella]NHN49168.1 molybdopterin-dependent oxidoreductase [Halostella sp. JP-L12]